MIVVFVDNWNKTNPWWVPYLLTYWNLNDKVPEINLIESWSCFPSVGDPDHDMRERRDWCQTPVLDRSPSLLERMFVMRSVRSVLLLIAFSHLARPANNKYDNGGGDGGGVKTHINIREPDNIARSHAGPQEYVTRHASKIVNKTTTSPSWRSFSHASVLEQDK